MRSETVERHRERVQVVLPYIAARVGSSADRLSLDELSRVALTAPSYFHRIFQAMTGEPIHRYVRRLRLEYAAYRLLCTDRPIIEIALDAGYESNAAFTRAFKQAFACPPTEFRAQPRARAGAGSGLARASSVRTKVAFLRHSGSYMEVRSTWERLRRVLAAHGLPARSMRAIGITHDPPEASFGGDFRYDACVVVPHEFRPRGGIGVKLIPALDTVAVRHEGVRDLLVCTYIHLVVEWARHGDRRALAYLPYYERFHQFPHLLDPHEVTAEVHVALD